MVFKKTVRPSGVPDSPEKLILELPRRKILGVLLHQGELLRTYATTALKAPDVAVQVPTGSGKTLVGLLIGEWRRRKFHERVVYLCPTRQLVHQVAEQAKEQYGLSVNALTGRSSEHSPSAKAQYQSADRVTITTYSSLFNTNPFFAEPEIIIVDDAHASENYIAALWTLRVERLNPEHTSLHRAIASVLQGHLQPTVFRRMIGEWDQLADPGWVEKLATPTLAEVADELIPVINEGVTDTDLRYPWQMIRDHLRACHVYISTREILIRPLIPPSSTHPAFANAKQRVFMSATLGAGGDLERLTGRDSILRLQVPEGWDRQGIGRRFFIFPGMSLPDPEIVKLRRRFMECAGRSLVLVPSDEAANAVAADVDSTKEYDVFRTRDLETSKKPFTQSGKSVAIMAGRYDGMDFPGDDCRLLFIEGLPKAMNLQERFLMSRMGANALFNDRVQTRVLQATGRCTRSLQDYSAVVVTGEELQDYLAERRRRLYFHPELQAEIEFGISQSQETSADNLVDNLKVFLANGPEWEEANKEILEKRNTATQQPMPAMEELAAVVPNEIRYQTKLWQADFEAALECAEAVLGSLTATELRGYRALWHYLAGSSAWMAAKAGTTRLLSKAREHFGAARDAAPGIPWLVDLSRYQLVPPKSDDQAILLKQIERVENVLARLGTVHDRAFARREREILDGLASGSSFEHAHKLLGELLGFEAGKEESDASPDPWWIADDICLVFEDHAGAGNDSTIDATKARQASGHPAWIKANISGLDSARILSVLVTPAMKATDGAAPHLSALALWRLEEFRGWSRDAVSRIRELRRTFSEPGDLGWRMEAATVFRGGGFDAPSLFETLKKQRADQLLRVVT